MSYSYKRRTILWVAGWEPLQAGGEGGQRIAALNIVRGGIDESFDVRKISSTMASVPPPPFRHRLILAGQRFVRFIAALIRSNIVVIFAADGFSLLEKTLMIMAAKVARRPVLLRLSSGHLLVQIKSSRLIRIALHAALQFSDTIVVQSDVWRRIFVSLVSNIEPKILVIGNGVDIERFQPGPPKTNPPTLLTVGWVQRSKGCFRSLEVLKQLRASIAGLTLQVVGDGPDLIEMKAQVKAYDLDDCVFFRGWVPHEDMPEIFSVSTVLLHLSDAEGLPNAVLESMAAGVAVVASNVGALSDIIVNGKNGYLVEPSDLSGAAVATGRLLLDSNHYQAVTQMASELVKANHDLASITAQWNRAFNDLCRTT